MPFKSCSSTFSSACPPFGKPSNERRALLCQSVESVNQSAPNLRKLPTHDGNRPLVLEKLQTIFLVSSNNLKEQLSDCLPLVQVSKSIQSRQESSPKLERTVKFFSIYALDKLSQRVHCTVSSTRKRTYFFVLPLDVGLYRQDQRDSFN